MVWKRVTPLKYGTFGNFHVKISRVLRCFFVLGVNPQNLPRGNGQRFAPTSDLSTRLYRDDLVDLLFTKAKVPEVFWVKKRLKFWGIPIGIVVPLRSENKWGWSHPFFVAENKWVSHGFTVFFTTVNGIVGPCTYGRLLITGDGTHFVGCVLIFKKLEKHSWYLGMYWGEVICLATIYIPSLKLTARFRSVCTGQIWASFLRLPTFATNKRPNKLGNWGYFTL